jgi:hypothetical protein
VVALVMKAVLRRSSRKRGSDLRHQSVRRAGRPGFENADEVGTSRLDYAKVFLARLWWLNEITKL